MTRRTAHGAYPVNEIALARAALASRAQQKAKGTRKEEGQELSHTRSRHAACRTFRVTFRTSPSATFLFPDYFFRFFSFSSSSSSFSFGLFLSLSYQFSALPTFPLFCHSPKQLSDKIPLRAKSQNARSSRNRGDDKTMDVANFPEQKRQEKCISSPISAIPMLLLVPQLIHFLFSRTLFASPMRFSSIFLKDKRLSS